MCFRRRKTELHRLPVEVGLPAFMLAVIVDAEK
jgi:hypothetical protein